ncbi:MAG: aminomethyl-transferring glycine dehydrogenase [Corynebacteriales bacterium]|nr:aminomethyl-transferring glycine dehydrogenase [Mycobacteriales bacterium]
MTDRPTLSDLSTDEFASRHIGLHPADQASMLSVLGYTSAEALTEAAMPGAIAQPTALQLPPAATEAQAIVELRAFAAQNRSMVNMLGLGYYGTHVPPVVQRNVLESPAWYTAYTPYQPEISQGRLEALLNFQTMVSDLTGLPTAGASLLDEGTAAAEAMALARRASKASADAVFVVDVQALPQTIDVLRTRAEPLGIPVVIHDLETALPDGEILGLLIQYPAADGRVLDIRGVIGQAKQRGAVVAVAADLLALALLTTPGELGADIAVGSAQRFGVPLGFGGPHAGYMAVAEAYRRLLPGRLVGVSKDADGNPAYRLALQTREQHIRREKATSNICTAQVLLAVMASMYAVWHGPDGIRKIATRVHRQAAVLAAGLRGAGMNLVHDTFFDTIQVRVPDADAVVKRAAELGVNLRLTDESTVGIACDETTTVQILHTVWQAFGIQVSDVSALDTSTDDALPESLRRTSSYLTHPVFSSHRSETELLRYLRTLADADYALDRGMIPLGSCTMKLNSTTEMASITWPEFANLHPFAPEDQTRGTVSLVRELESWLAEITGYDAVSVQPNAGSQGELAGLLAIHKYHQSNGDDGRDVCLIPSSAHGTNAASAVMAGMRVVVVACDDNGNIDLTDLRTKIEKHAQSLAAIMVTYPSTHGVYEGGISELCALVHDAGGQVYVDGANLNALVGFAQPGRFGADVSHLNLHKTFCIPHGGGGPGVGPVAVREHLAPFLPSHPLRADAGPTSGPGAISAAPFGSAGILQIPWAYIRMMGAAGLRQATAAAVLAANYVAARLRDHYPILYTGAHDLVAHECIVDIRPLTKATGITVDDVAKRLIDYGFHAPTMSFPVAGTLMVEPTESEPLAELDRFVEAMIAIKAEAERVGQGEWPKDDNPLVNAPHTAATLTGAWEHPYGRDIAVFPGGQKSANKYWPPVRRVDNAYGDRHLVCACPPPEAFE